MTYSNRLKILLFFSLSIAIIGFISACKSNDSSQMILTQNPDPTKNGIDVLTFSPDGSLLLAGCRDNTANVIDVTTKKVILTYKEHQAVIYAAAFIHNGKQAVTGSADGSVQLWDVESGQKMDSFSVGQPYENKVNFIQPSPVSKSEILLAYDDHKIRIRDLTSKQFTKVLEGHKSFVLRAIFSADGKQILSAGGDFNGILWDSVKGTPIKQFPVTQPSNHVLPTECLHYSLDGTKFLTAGIDKNVKIWDAKTVTVSQQWMGNNTGIKFADFFPDGERVVTAGLDKLIKVWDANSGKLLMENQDHKSAILSGAIDPSGSIIATGDTQGLLVLWKITKTP